VKSAQALLNGFNDYHVIVLPFARRAIFGPARSIGATLLLPLVTIAIPTYNRADSYLPQALQCALNQTYDNLEVIVADNCSTDATGILIAGLNDRRLRYFRHEINIGPTNNFNFCIERARGKYLLILHDDDRIDPDFIETCMTAATDIPDAGMIRTGMRWIDMHGNVLGQASNHVAGLPIEEFFSGWFAGRTPMHLCSTLFDTAKLKTIGGLRSKHHRFDDVIAEVRLAAKYKRIDIPDVKASCRHHSDQGTEKGQIGTWCEESMILLDLMCNLAPPSKAALVRREGVKFFVRHNYKIAAKVKSPKGRLAAYGTILRHFDYPVLRLISLILSRYLRAIKMKTKKTLKRAPGLDPAIASIRNVWRG
jgi:glycosyltransferase involved in cell wall biosynthesis